MRQVSVGQPRVWATAEPALARAGNVRAAQVARGDAKLSIGCYSDARSEPKVAIAGAFPDVSHKPTFARMPG
jgi:hypothetical protein